MSFALAAYGFLCSGRAETHRQREDAEKEIRQGEILYDDDELATTEVHDEIARLQARVERLQMALFKAQNEENANSAGEEALYESNVGKGYGGIDEDEEPIEEAVGELHETDSRDAAREEVLRFLGAYPTWGFNVPRMQSWGVKQGYTELSRSRISPSELHEVIKELVQELRVYTRLSSTGSTLYQIAR